MKAYIRMLVLAALMKALYLFFAVKPLDAIKDPPFFTG